ncbi:DEAD/DEAH box helicase [Lactobacillus acetotolerans]|uniref:DEAD/DEAH box helicase n=1 Tax=Lactobacillus acetotolerans TaxID=1600 RepID=UPI002FD87CF9
MNDFRSGKLKVLCNNDLISEGLDIPNCEAVIMCRPTASLVLYLQQSMRCRRYVDGKQAIIIDHVGNYVRFGLPDDDRQWSLEGRNSKGKVDVPDIHTCQYCYQVFYEWTADNRCPYCGELKPEADSRTPEGKKKIEQAKMIEIANRKIEKSDSLISIYEHFKARKTMNIGNVRRPINAAIREKGLCSSAELSEFARYLNVKKNYIFMLYKHRY